MRNRRTKWAGSALAVAVSLSACGGDSTSRTDAVAAITTEAVPARFADFAIESGELVDAAVEWCGTGLDEPLLESVDETRLAWVAVLPFWFGPVADRRSRFIVDPTVTEADVVELLESDGPIDATSLRDLYGADQRGLAAIERVVELAGGVTPTARACDHVVASAELISEEADALAAEWIVAGPDFAGDEAAANEALESMVNEILFGIVGLVNDPAIDVATTKLEAMRWTMLGDPTAEADDPDGNVDGIGALLDSSIVEQLTTEFDAAADLDPDAVKAVEVTITTNVVSALGLSVQFSDADGDG